LKEITTNDDTLFVSYSRYSNFEKCPFKYKKMYIDKIETFQDNEFSIFGTAMHSTIQDFVEKKYNKLLKENQINLNNMKLTKEIHSIVKRKKY